MNEPSKSSLLVRLQAVPNRPLIVYRGETFTVDDIQELTAGWVARLQEEGICVGDVCAFRGDYSPNVCALFLALVELGTIIVPLTPAVDVEIEGLLTLAAVEWFIDCTTSDCVTISRIGPRKILEMYEVLRQRECPGLVVFSSGSTGTPKGIVHDFEKVLRRFEKPRSGFRTLQFLMLDHFGGINTLLGALANGGVIIVAEDRSPAAVSRLIEEASVELLPVTPTFLTLFIATGAHLLHSMGSVKLISYGTEVMPEATLHKVQRAFPQARLQQTYGLSEVGVLRSASRSSDSLWVKVGGDGFNLKVVNNILYIKSDFAMLGYLNAEDPFDRDGWFCTHDEVEQDGEWLRIIGRTTDLINVGGQKVFPAEVESVILTDSNVLDVSVSGKRHALMGSVVTAEVVLSNPEDPATLRERLRALCRERLASYKVPVRFVIMDELRRSARYKKVRA